MSIGKRRTRPVEYALQVGRLVYLDERGALQFVPNTALGPVSGGSGAVSDGDKGDITVSGAGTVWTIDNQAVQLDDLSHASAPSLLLGRGNASSGQWEEITIGSGLTMTGSVLSASGSSGPSIAQVAARAFLGM